MPRAAAIPAAERRAHAVRALLELADAMAPDQIRTAAIAARMGVSHGALFRHFPSREALWEEAVRWATASLAADFDAVDRLDQPPLARLEALLLCHADFHLRQPGLMRMLFAELQRPGTSPARQRGQRFLARFRDRLAQLLGAAQEVGQLRRDQPAQELASLLIGANQGLLLQALVFGSHEDLLPRLRSAQRLILRGVLVQPDPWAVGPAAAPAVSPVGRPGPPCGRHRHRPAAPPGDPPAG